MPFASLGLAPALVQALRACGYAAPTPVQAAALPPALAGRDLRAQAPTGSGKTLAFGLAALQGLLRAPQAGQPPARPPRWGPADRRPAGNPPRQPPRRTQALVLVPTRELAAQVGEVLRELTRALPEVVRVVIAHGGVSINPQMMDLRGGAEIVVATPGRLLDLVDHRALRLDALRLLVLDEADRLLDLGFADELAAVRALLPSAPPQTLLFSATFPDAVKALAGTWLREPVELAVEAAGEDAPAITQRALQVDTARRTPLLRHLLETQGWSRVLVFVATRYSTEHVADKLGRAGIAAAALHGELSQGARSDTLRAFRAGTLRVLVATDVAARGLDIVGLPAVINYDLPRAAADYTHRIGRTGRAGTPGQALSFVTAASEAHFRLIEKRQAQRVEREQLPGFEPSETAPPPSATDPHGTGGVKGRRPSKKDKLRAAGLR